jgi:hypothetical protein
MLRRLLAIAVHRLGGEMKVSQEEILGHWELGVDHHSRPTVITGFRISSGPGRE